MPHDHDLLMTHANFPSTEKSGFGVLAQEYEQEVRINARLAVRPEIIRLGQESNFVRQ